MNFSKQTIRKNQTNRNNQINCMIKAMTEFEVEDSAQDAIFCTKSKKFVSQFLIEYNFRTVKSGLNT